MGKQIGDDRWAVEQLVRRGFARCYAVECDEVVEGENIIQAIRDQLLGSWHGFSWVMCLLFIFMLTNMSRGTACQACD